MIIEEVRHDKISLTEDEEKVLMQAYNILRALDQTDYSDFVDEESGDGLDNSSIYNAYRTIEFITDHPIVEI